ncbi:MAG TPA: AMP-binding protein, partial [Pseudoxanthomonas sp.]|nr:AMP-binding protein [Pseudoxanthomonas sp.]
MSATVQDSTTQPSGRFWLASYPDGMAGDIAPLGHPSIGAMVESCCAQFADRPAFTSMGKTLTFKDLEAASGTIAAWLQSRGLEKGDRVAVMMPNILQNPVIIFGILRAGLVVVNVNPLYTPRELEHQLKDAGAKALFVLENFAGTVAQVVSRTAVKHMVVTTMGDMLGLKGLIVNLVVRKVKKLVPAWSLPGHVPFTRVMAEGARQTLKRVSVAPGDTAFLQYTGGTTGVSKGATLTHANLLSNMEQIKLWIEPTFRIKKRPDQLVFICALPLYHIFALTVNGLMGIALGGHNVLIANPRDIPAFVKELGKYRVHIFPGLNTLFNALMNNPEFAKLDFSEL